MLIPIIGIRALIESVCDKSNPFLYFDVYVMYIRYMAPMILLFMLFINFFIMNDWFCFWP